MTSPSSTVDHSCAATISAVHPDVIGAHILTRLDGPTLASAAATSSQLHSLSREPSLWENICRSTWPSTASPRVSQVISSFPGGHRSFFSDSFPLPINHDDHSNQAINLDRTPELISAVDVHYRGKLILSKVVETETSSGWFRCSPFRVDLLHPKDVVPTEIPYPRGDDTCRDLAEGLTLSWIVIDPIGRRSMNLSSHRPVEAQRHWLSGEVHVRFSAVLLGSSSEFTQCGVQLTCGGWSHCGGGGEEFLQVREVCLVVEDMDGTHLKGRESLVILQRALEGKRGKGGKMREEEGRKRCQEYLERKRERKERRLRTEGALDIVFAFFFGAFAFSLLSVGIFQGVKGITYW
ncbi:hypothetical protein L484_019179 [Morus notabilis]|uniref:F-box domain-containing protein n=1 Tax=Morus notabilis TaxID=981085 RepID=W9R2E1_9ROSA|nr:probable F-box protein At2g36090 [Morus notabilis]EXB54609.1 hypothetical protein L484_019179 [Morus notabilis]